MQLMSGFKLVRKPGVAVLAALALLFSGGGVFAKDNTPFGVGFTLRNFPNSNLADIQDAMFTSTLVGGHMSLVWTWSRQSSIPLLQNVLPLTDVFGLKSLMQIAPTALGDPAPPFGLPKSFADPGVRAQYLNDVAFWASFQPDYLNICAEVNIMAYFNPDEFQNYVSLYQEAYDIAKQISPNTKVGFSMLDLLWVGRDQEALPSEFGFDRIDFIGFTSYPDPTFYDGLLGEITIQEFPEGWYAQLRQAYPDTPLLMTELGWPNVEQSSSPDQAAFVRELPRLFRSMAPELITWTLMHDVNFFDATQLSPEQVAFLENIGVDPQVLFNRFNGMGLLDTTGAPKPAWFEALGLEFDPPPE